MILRGTARSEIKGWMSDVAYYHCFLFVIWIYFVICPWSMGRNLHRCWRGKGAGSPCFHYRTTNSLSLQTGTSFIPHLHHLGNKKALPVQINYWTWLCNVGTKTLHFFVVFFSQAPQTVPSAEPFMRGRHQNTGFKNLEQNKNSGLLSEFISTIETSGVPLDHEIVICSASVTSNESSGPCQDCSSPLSLF